MLIKLALFLHLLGACIWVGGHLYLAIRVMPPILKSNNIKAFLEFENSYEPFGIAALAIQVLTGFYMVFQYLPNFSVFINGQAGILGHLILGKILWLLLTIITAIHARFFVIAKLINGTYKDNTLKIMFYHIIAICLWSILFVATGIGFR